MAGRVGSKQLHRGYISRTYLGRTRAHQAAKAVIPTIWKATYEPRRTSRTTPSCFPKPCQVLKAPGQIDPTSTTFQTLSANERSRDAESSSKSAAEVIPEASSIAGNQFSSSGINLCKDLDCLAYIDHEALTLQISSLE
jgi:hypothetical protein